jgi:hypothetical protein
VHMIFITTLRVTIDLELYIASDMHSRCMGQTSIHKILAVNPGKQGYPVDYL